MPVLNGAAVVLLQDAEFTRHDVHLAMIFLFVIALVLVLQAMAVVVGGVFAAKLMVRMKGVVDRMERKTGPILDKTNLMLQDLGPKVQTITDKVQSLTENAEQISSTVRVKVDELGVTVSELNETVREMNVRTAMQVARVDGIVSDALHATEEISKTVQDGIKGPVRQIAGIVAGVKAGIETLVARSPFGGRR